MSTGSRAWIRRLALDYIAPMALLAIGFTLGYFLAGCASPARAAPDAVTTLPPCSSVGCANGAALCKRNGQCACPQSDGTSVACQRVPAPPDAAPEPDAKTYEDANEVTDPRIDAKETDAP